MSDILYIDSSFLLAIVLREKKYSTYVRVWEKAAQRVSSILLEAESVVSLRRTWQSGTKRPPDDWLKQKEGLVRELLDEVSMRFVDMAVIQNLESRHELSACRTLDALHLSTALEFQKNSSQPIEICTLDKAMSEAARNIGFAVFSEIDE